MHADRIEDAGRAPLPPERVAAYHRRMQLDAVDLGSALAWMLVVPACGGDEGGDSGETTGTTAVVSTSSETSSGTSSETTNATSITTTGSPPVCDVPPSDCTQCWECAKIGPCKQDYDTCAASIDCAGSLACVGYMCPADGLEQSCIDHCCQNCAEHFACPFVDAVITCVETQCADLCGPATCAM